MIRAPGPSLSGEGEPEDGEGKSKEIHPLVDHNTSAAKKEVAHRVSHYATALLTVGFMAIFTAFISAECLQTSVNSDLGYVNLCIIYLLTALCTNIAPVLLRRLDSRGTSFRGVFILCTILYGNSVLSNAWPTALSMIPASIGVGAAGPFLWTAQKEYIGRVALQASRDTGVALEQTTTMLDALFNAGLMSCGAVGNFVNSTVVIFLGADKLSWLFIVLAGMSLLAIIPFIMLPGVTCRHDNRSLSNGICMGIWRPMRFAMQDHCMRLFVILNLSQGWCIATQWGDYSRFSVSAVVGIKLQGYVMGTYFLANAAVSFLWGRLISSSRISQLQSLTIATVLNTCFFALWFLGLSHAPHFYYDTNTHNWESIPGSGAPTVWENIAVFSGAVLVAVGQSAYQIQIGAVIQVVFQETPYSVEANGSPFLWQALGRSIQFLFSALNVDACRSRVFISICLTVMNFWTIKRIGLEWARRLNEPSRNEQSGTEISASDLESTTVAYPVGRTR